MLKNESNVFLVAHSQFRGIYIGIARKLKELHAINVHLYASTEQEATYYNDRNFGIFSSVKVSSILHSACREVVNDEKSVIVTACQNEVELGVSINELAVSDRHFGRGYALGGFKHPRSRMSEETSYIQFLNGFNAQIEFWRRELNEKKPDLILNAPKILCVLSRIRNIPVRILVSSRYMNYYYWSVNEFFESSVSMKNNMVRCPTKEFPFDEPVSGYTAYRKKHDSDTKFVNIFRKTAYLILRQAYWRLKKYEKAKGYYLFENIRYIWRLRRDAIKMTDRKLPCLTDFKGKRFVFFPLATEPEIALQQLSPEYLSQLSCIQAICKYLPADHILVVKEHHTALGRRPTDFYQQISEFKNATFMNMSEPGFSVVKEAEAVVTITGTAGFEAAVMGKPVIVFGRHNIYNELPHVLFVPDEVSLREALSKALRNDWADAQKDGKRFLSALVENSFDLGSYSQWNPEVIEQDVIDRALANLQTTLVAH